MRGNALTSIFSEGELLGKNAASGLYSAVRVCNPSVEKEAGKVAMPPVIDAVPMRFPPSKKETVPVTEIEASTSSLN